MINNFIEIPASKRSISKRKKLFGLGVNDADYIVNPKINGKIVRCPFYRSWKNMITRCYSKNQHSINPTYKDCSVCDEWLTFSKFKAWMIKQDWQGKHLDKDIVKTENKIYSPEACLFVTQEINKITLDRKADRGKHPQGVCFEKALNKFKAYCSVNGKNKHLGVFDTEEKASLSYKAFKYNIILTVAEKQNEPLRGYLIRIAKEIKGELPCVSLNQ